MMKFTHGSVVVERSQDEAEDSSYAYESLYYTQLSPHVHCSISAVKVYLGPEGEVKVNDAAVTLPYEKMFRTSKKSTESMSVISAGRTVSTA